MESKRFNDALLKAVDFAFYSLGKSCRQALYFHLRIRFQVRRKEIPEKVEEFDNALRLIFKDGAFFLERLIVEKLCENLGLEFDSIQYSDFVETIARVRAMVLEGELLSTVSARTLGYHPRSNPRLHSGYELGLYRFRLRFLTSFVTD